MKLNPFNKKSTAYYDKVKAEYDQLHAKLMAARKELREAEADCEQKEKRYHELAQRGSSYSTSPEEKKASLAASAARNLVSRIRGNIGQLESRISAPQRIAQAPEQFALATQTLDELLTQKRTATGEIECLDSLIAKVGKRIVAAEARIATETQSATQTMLDAEEEFTVPEALAKAEAELRLGKTTLADLQAKRNGLTAQLADLPKAICEAEQRFINHRAVIAEIELYEQLMPVMRAVARASAARRETSYRHDESRFEIEIPRELVEVAQAALASEVPTD